MTSRTNCGRRRLEEAGLYETAKIGHHRTSVAVVAALAMILSACSSTTNSSSSGRSGASPIEATKSSAPTGDAGVQRAAAALDPVRKQPTKIGITAKLSKLPTGKRVDFIECGVPNCKEIGNGLEPAMKALGVQLKRVSAGNTPEEFSKAFDQAVQDRPDGVLVGAITKKIYGSQLDKFGQMNIPVVSWANTDDAGGALKKVYLSSKAFSVAGEQIANYTASDSKGKARVLYLQSSIFDFAIPQLAAAKDTLQTNCGSCSLEAIDVTPDQIGTAIPSRVVSYVQQHPDTTYVVGTFGPLLTGVSEALKSSGLGEKVQLVSCCGADSNFEYIQQGKGVDLTVSNNYLAWVAADGIARAMVGDDASLLAINDATLPWFQLVTKNNINWKVGKEPYPGVADYQAQFKALWGVTQ